MADFNQICMDITLGHDEELIMFGDLDLILTVTAGLKLRNVSQKVFVCMLFHEPFSAMLPNLNVCIIGAYHRMVCEVGAIVSEKIYHPIVFHTKHKAGEGVQN